MNPLSVLAAAQRCNAAYVMDKSAVAQAFAALGMIFVDQYRNATHQAVYSKDQHGYHYLSISGTRFFEGDNLDLLDDIWLAPVKVQRGGEVASGVYSGMDDLWMWMKSHLPTSATLNIEGHSLGAERALLAPLFLPKEQIGDLHAFEAPQTATQEFWDAYREELSRAVHTVCGADIFYNWPPKQGYTHDAQSDVLWLKANSIEVIRPSQWPIGANEGDHAIERVIAYIQAAIVNGYFPH